MTAEDDSESGGLLAEHRLGQMGLTVKLDKGFAEGTYCVYVEFDERATRDGFTAAHRAAGEYCAGLKGQLARWPGYVLSRIEDGSRSRDARRKRDLEATFLSFTIAVTDGKYHDQQAQEDFRVALLRAGQAWEQVEARAQAQRRKSRQEQFGRQLARLLDGAAYADMDAAMKERLLVEVPALAFARRDIGL
jgi:hypothetical protein